MIKVHRITNKNGSEIVSEGTIVALKRLGMVTFKGTRRVTGATVYEYAGRCK